MNCMLRWNQIKQKRGSFLREKNSSRFYNGDCVSCTSKEDEINRLWVIGKGNRMLNRRRISG